MDQKYTTKIDWGLDMGTNILEHKMCYMHLATPKEHLKLNSWKN